MRSLQAICIILMLASGIRAKGQVYYLCFGSAHYDFDSVHNKKPKNLMNLPEAHASARIMADILEKYAGAKGKVVYSSDSSLFSKQLLQTEIGKMVRRIGRDTAADDPLLVIYFCGHGFSENLVGMQFLLPGNLTKSLYFTDYEQLRYSCITMEDIFMPVLVSSRYLILLDCCRNRGADNLLRVDKVYKHWDSLTGKRWQDIVTSLRDQAKRMYTMAINIQDPIVFADKQLRNVPVTDYPSNDLGIGTTDQKIGPICRRTILLLGKMQKGQTINLKQFIRGITSPSLDDDKTTPVSSTGYDFTRTADIPLFRRN